MAFTTSTLLPPPEGKRRTAPIPIDYLRQPSWFDLWKSRLAIGAALVTIAAIAVVLISPARQRVHSRGPLAHVHSALNDDCQSCHVDFVPISGSAFSLTSDNWAHASDTNCKACHTGHVHHANQSLDPDTERESANCAACHVEHRGSEANLLMVADRHCTVCHSDLAAHRSGPSKYDEPIAEVIDSFATDTHPTFRSIRKDPGRLAFNHALHMTAGLTDAGKGVRPLTSDDLPERFRGRYSAKNVNGRSLITLDCDDCHELQRGGASPAGLGVQTERLRGDYFQPVLYERHCQACHPLPFRAGYQHEPEAQVPHGTSAAQLERAVRNLTLAEVVGKQGNLEHLDPSVPVPGNERLNLLPDTAALLVDEELERSARHVNAACRQCHSDTHDKEADERDLFISVAPVNIPFVWFQHARFNHTPHFLVGCASCHAGAYSDSEMPSALTRDILVPDRDNCLQCHAPANEVSEKYSIAARFDCAECHRYHGGGHPLRFDASPINKLPQ
jgi:hypothetical protein